MSRIKHLYKLEVIFVERARLTSWLLRLLLVDEHEHEHEGYNQWGELGLDDKEDRGDEPNEMGDNLPFVDLGDDAKVVSVACGDWHT